MVGHLYTPGPQTNSRLWLEVLRTAAHSGGDFNQIAWMRVFGGPLSSNTIFLADGYLTGDVEAPQYLRTGTHTGTFTQTPAKEMPQASVFDDIYLPLATEIDFTSIPYKGGVRELAGVCGNSSNPTGQ